MKRVWLLSSAAIAGALLYRAHRRGALQRLAANVRAFDLPNAGLYDQIAGRLLEGFYARVAKEVAARCPTGEVLEVSSGPGRLAVRLALSAPELRVTGLDITPEMVQMAARHAAAAGLADRLRFDVGDVATLPYQQARFDGAVSTLSLHHWPDPSRGLEEIHRVLKPGAEAFIYDLTGPFWQAIHHRPSLATLATGSPFGGGEVDQVRWPGPFALVSRLRLRRAPAAEA